MAVLERSELQASSLADLHAIADQLGLDGFRRLRKADLIDTILGDAGPKLEEAGDMPAAFSEDSDGGEPEERAEAGRGRLAGSRAAMAGSRC